MELVGILRSFIIFHPHLLVAVLAPSRCTSTPGLMLGHKQLCDSVVHCPVLLTVALECAPATYEKEALTVKQQAVFHCSVSFPLSRAHQVRGSVF